MLSCGGGCGAQSWIGRPGLGIDPRPASADEINRRRGCGAGKGIRVHRNVLPADEVAEVDGMPVMSVPRTILDLAGVLDRGATRPAPIMRSKSGV